MFLKNYVKGKSATSFFSFFCQREGYCRGKEFHDVVTFSFYFDDYDICLKLGVFKVILFFEESFV
jgi:hypothetical protein